MMKKILITGLNSYIGNSLETYLNANHDEYQITKVSVRDNKWQQLDFTSYDVVFHVAGIAHVKSSSNIYDEINYHLAYKVAQKAKKDGIKLFIFMSSMSIYGASQIIDHHNATNPKPNTPYGKSKLAADLAIQKLADKKFKTAIIRAPMVYGPNCQGNFPKLVKLINLLPVFPNITNKRSMIYIDNLTELLKQIIDQNIQGIFYPQNKEYVSTVDMVEYIAQNLNKKIIYTKLFNFLIKLFIKKSIIINKLFDTKIYTKNLSNCLNYNIIEYKQSIEKSIQNNKRK